MKKRILLIDDDRIFGSTLVFGLELAGYEVHYQPTVIDINDTIGTIKPDILVLDVEIDNVNGIALAQEIKLCNHKLPIIFVSSHCESYYAVSAIKSGGEHYLRKPIEIEELLAYINKHIGNNSCNIIYFGNSKLDIETNNLYINNVNTPLQLSHTESKLLKLLIANMNQLVSNDEIQQTLYGDAPYNNRTINNIITRLRKFLCNDRLLEIENRKKCGYIMVAI